ncbi:MAG: hypothetical protein GXX90_03590 [Microbacteriaceae bacterium]|nr:hypothetical protein [Microbacteriaceae bacterium]
MAKRKSSWDELTQEQQGGIILLGAAQIGLMLFAQGALLGRPKELVRGPKWLWFLGNLVNFVGPIAYLVLGKRRRPAA